MKEAKIFNTIIQTIPQWYLGSSGIHVYRLAANDYSIDFGSHHAIDGHLLALLNFAKTSIPQWVAQQPKIPTPNSLAKIKEDLALEWLGLHEPEIDWNKWIAFGEGLRYRSYENQTICINLIISQGTGSCDITDVHLQKVFDPLASHPHVYMRVDKNLQFLDYDEIQWKEVKDPEEYKFSPEFLQPFLSILRPEEYFVHLTAKGEIIIASDQGMLASCRKGQWHLYDHIALRDCIVDIIDDAHVGRNLIETLFDLSYHRHGALLIFDPDSRVVPHIINRDSLIRDQDIQFSDLPRRLLAPKIRSIKMGSAGYKERKRRLFMEIAEIDGALIFDSSHVLAFGAMIQSHPDVGSYFGARMTAAQSSQLWGGHAFMISSDGEIIVFFKQGDGTFAELRFM